MTRSRPHPPVPPVRRRRPRRKLRVEDLEGRLVFASRLFALPTNDPNAILEVNPATGAVVNTLPAPEPATGGADGLAFDGASLFFMSGNGGRRLYELNPDTGAVLDTDVVSAGSGQFDGLAAVGGRVYLQDFAGDAVVAFDPATDTVTGTISVAADLAGGIAGATGPDALVASVSGSTVAEIDPATGAVTRSFAPGPATIRGLAVVNGEVYLGLGDGPAVGVFDRAGIFLRSFALASGAGVSALASDAGTDTGVSARPSRPDLADGSDTGLSAADDVTNLDNSAPAKALQFVVSGTVPGATVTLYAGGTAVGSAVAGGPSTTVTTSGSFDLADGTRSITARQTEAGKTQSADSAALAVTIDTAAPATPGAPDLQAASDTGVSATDNNTSDTTPTFTVSGGPYLRLFRDGVRVSAEYETGTSITPGPLADGAAAYKVAAVDAAGNQSALGTGLTVTIDTLAPNALDTSFDGDGKLLTNVVGVNDEARDVVVVAGDKVVVVGQAVSGGNAVFALARYNANGSLDTGFGAGGKVTTAIGPGSSDAFAVAVQSDGYLVVAGRAANAGGNYDFALARYDTSGNLDPTFGTGGVVTTPVGSGTDVAYDVVVQSDGRVVVAGTSHNGTDYDFALVRYNADGSLDPTFGVGGKLTTAFAGGDDQAYAVALQADGKIVAAGRAFNAGTRDDFALARYNPDGSLDAGFGAGGKVTTAVATNGIVPQDQANGLAVQADGKIVLAGQALMAGTSYDFALARYDTAGNLDPTFGTGGVTTADFAGDIDVANDLAVQADGRVVAVGYAVGAAAGDSEYSFAVARFDSAGALDPTYDRDGRLATHVGTGPGSESILAAAVDSQGRLVAAGGAYNGTDFDFGLARYPLAPLAAPDLQSGSDSGVSDTDNLTFDSTPTFSVSPGSTYFRFYRNGTQVSTAYETGGSYTTGLQADGAAAYAYTGVDAAGNESGPSAALTVTIDTVPPAPPGGLDLDAASDSGVSATDNVTSDNTPTFAVSAAGYYRLFRESPQIPNLQIGGNYQTASSVTLTAQPDSTYVYTVRAVDDAGNLSLPGPALRVTIDTQAPLAPGILDHGWDGDGKATTDFLGSTSDSAKAVVVQPDGKVIVGGAAGGGNNTNFALARVNPDGSPDATFGRGGQVVTDFDGYTDTVAGVALQADGKIVVAGNYSPGPGLTRRFVVVRYNPNGSPDAGFGAGGRATTSFIGDANAMAVQADGKILVVGRASVNGGNDFGVLRFNADGSLDTSFDADGLATTDFGTFDDYPYAVAVQADGKVVVAGSRNSASDVAVARYNPDGTPDTTFDADGKVVTDLGSSDDAGRAVAVQADGKIVVAGRANSDFAAVRYNPDGSLDATFDGDGKATTDVQSGSTDYGEGLALQADGRLVVVGRSNSRFAAVRYNANGSLDAGFDGDGKVVVDVTGRSSEANGVAVQADGRVVVAGYADAGFAPAGDAAVVRLNADGTPDAGFDGDGKLLIDFLGSGADTARDMAVQADGKVLVAGTTSAAHYRLALARYNPDGSPDAGFGAGGTVATQIASAGAVNYDADGAALALQADGKVVVAGTAFGFNSGTRYVWALARYNPDGAPDPTFDGDGQVTTDFGAPFDGAQLYAVAVQADGKVVAAGATNTGSSSGRNVLLARYNPDGSLDTSFGTGGKVITDFAGTEDIAYRLLILPDGKLLVGGSSSTSGSNNFLLARYNADGSLDTGFDGDGKVTTDFGTSGDIAYGLALQPDGKVVAAGQVTGSNFALARYHPDGSLDTGFDGDGKVTTDFAGSPFDVARAVAVLPDGRIVAVGYNSPGVNGSFGTELGSVANFSLTRYNPDGSLDTSLDGDGKLVTDFAGNTDQGYAVAVDGGTVLVAGSALTANNYDFAVARYRIDPVAAADLRAASDLGASPTDNLTSTASPAFDVARDDSYFRLYRDGALASGPFESGGGYATAGQPDGPHAYAVTNVDAAGNESAPDPGLAVAIDTQAPTAAVTPVSPDPRAIAVDGLEIVFTEPVLGFDLADLRLTRDGGADLLTGAQTLTTGDGRTFVLGNLAGLTGADGAYTLTLSAAGTGVADAAGNPLAAPAGTNWVVDATAPTVSVPDLDPASDSGASDADDLTGDDTPTFTGTAEAGSTVTLYRDGQPVGSGTATGGAYRITTAPLADGTYTFTAAATDAVGNAGGPTAGLVVTIDTGPPAAPAVTGVSPDLGASGTDGLTGDPTLSVLGTAEAGGTVTVTRVGVGVVGTASVGPDGTWSFDYTGTALPDGPHGFTARTTDPAGNVGPESGPFVAVIDTEAPSADVEDVTPDPRRVGVSDLTIVFSTPVTGFDLPDLELTREGGPDLLTGSQTLTTADNVTWTLGNLGGLTADLGDYTLTVVAAGSGIEDAAGNALAADAADTWTVINTGPVLDAGGDPALTPVPRNATDPAGDVVSSFIGAAITDPNPGALRGIAVVGLAGSGTWQYRLGAGAWTDFGPTGTGTARLLRDSDAVRFVPAAGFVGTARLTYHAWDRTAGTAGGTGDLTAGTGGTTPYSSASETATLRVAMTLTPVPEDSPAPAGDVVGGLLATLVTDADPKARKGMAVVGVTGAANGNWQYNAGAGWAALAAAPDRAVLLRDTDRVRFVPGPHWHGQATLHFRAWDQTGGAAGGTADLTRPGATGGGAPFSTARDLLFVRVLSVNDAPILDAGGEPPVARVAPGTADPPGDLVRTLLGASATDADGDAVGIAVTAVTGRGAWQVRPDGAPGWSPLSAVSDRAPRRLAAPDRVRFVPAAGFSGPARLTFRAWDGLAASRAAETATVLVTTAPAGPANTAPVLDTAPAPALTPVREDTPAPAGDRVSSLLGTAVTDPDAGALVGIAVTGTSGSAVGTWQFSTDGGASWQAVGPVSVANALLLRGTDRVRFRPNRDAAGAGTLTYRAWDRTRGTAGARADLTLLGVAGGASPFSTAAETASVTVTPVNDAPVLDTRLSPTLTPVLPGASDPAGNPVSGLLRGASDVEGDPIGLAVTGVSGRGTWQARPGGAGSWAGLAAVSTRAPALLGPAAEVRFLPDPLFVGVARLTYRAWDGTATSAATETAGLTVNAVDDRPVLDPQVKPALTPVRVGDPNPAGDPVSALLVGVTDPDPGADLGMAVVGVGTGAGVWQVDTGSGWQPLGPVSGRTPRLLRGADRVRFVPAAEFVGTAALTFRAWDAGSQNPAGPLALSAGTATAVAVVNSAPVLDV